MDPGRKQKPGPLTQTPKHPGSMVPLVLLQVLGRAFGRMFCFVFGVVGGNPHRG